MPRKFEDFSKEELDILYHFVKKKLMHNSQRARVNDFLQFDGNVHDTHEIQTILNTLVEDGYLQYYRKLDSTDKQSFGFIPFSKLGNIEVEYGIKDRSTYEILYKKFTPRHYRDKTINALKKLGNFLLQNIVTIIVALVTSVLTTYISLRLFGA